MCDNYNYPPGADTPDAPWNQIEPPEVEFEATATVTLNKDADVLTDKLYNDDGDWEPSVNAHEIWSDNYMDIPALLAELVKYIDGELEGKPSHQRKWELQKMKESAQGWTVIDEEYELD